MVEPLQANPVALADLVAANRILAVAPYPSDLSPRGETATVPSPPATRLRRRDWVLRQVVEDCQAQLMGYGFALTHRGRVTSIQVVGFRRPCEGGLPLAAQASIVVGHDPAEQVVVAYLS